MKCIARKMLPIYAANISKFTPEKGDADQGGGCSYGF